MDFIQGYGSDDSSSSSEQAGSTNATPTPAPTPALAPLVVPAVTTTKKNDNDKNKQKKGTRMLKLNSVLPADILERLTRSTVQSGNNNYDDDSSSSSDDDHDGDYNDNEKKDDNRTNTKHFLKKRRGGNNNDEKHKSKNKTLDKKNFFNIAQKNIAGDLGLNSLLSDLQSVEPTFHNSASKDGKEQNNDDNDICGSGSGGDCDGDGKIGFAFINVSNTVVRKKTNDVTDDIHAATTTTTNTRKQSKLEVEDVDSDEDENETIFEETNLNNNAAIQMFPKASGRHQQLQPSGHQSQTNTESNIPKALSTTTNIAFTSSIKRPRKTITSAPAIPSNYQSLKLSTSQNMQPSPYNNHISYGEQAQTTTALNDTQTQPKKMSKRELQKALRQGNFEAIDSTNITQNIDPTNYNAPSESDLLATASSSDRASSEYKMGGLQMYVPGEGTTSASGGVTSKQRSKHQIHSLVASARKLESERSRMGAMGVGGRKTRKVDAKRKYGW